MANVQRSGPPPEQPEGGGDDEKDEGDAPKFSLASLAALLVGFAALPKALEQHPRGGLQASILLILILLAWIAVNWIKYR